MFRDLKEYQEIAKIYAEKVSIPENLEERKGSSSAELAQYRKDAFSSKPNTSTYQSNRDKLNKQRSELNKGRAEKQFSVLKPKPGSQGRVSRSSQNMAGKPKPMPSTAEIRAKNPNVVPGTRTNEIGAKGGGKPSSGDLSMFKDKKPEVSTMTKQGKPRTKAQMMAAKRIASGKTIDDVKAANTASMKAKAAERNQKFQDAKKSGNLAQFRKDNPKMSGADRAKAMAKARLAKKAAMEEYTPYDFVLEYLLSTEQVATIEEANYVMTEMDGETIQGIVEAQKKTLIEKPDDGYIGPKFLGIKNPINKARKDYQLDKNLKRLSKTGDSPEARDMLNIPRDYEITPEQKKKYGFN